jgi:hypothetical protein
MTLNDDTQEHPESAATVRAARRRLIGAVVAAILVLALIVVLALGVDVFALVGGVTAEAA